MSLPEPYWRSRCGRHVIYCAKCEDVFPHLGMVDVIISDPPYGDLDTHATHLSSVILKNGEPDRQALGFDGITLMEAIVLEGLFIQTAKRWVIFTCEWKYVHALPHLVRMGIWRKPDGAPQFTGDRPGTGWEAVAICHREGKKRWNGGGKHGFWVHPKGQNTSGHPTGKPLGLFADFVLDFSEPDEVVLDPFIGSGTTGVACIRTGRKFIGIEINEDYCKIAVNRMERELAQGILPLTIEPKHEQVDLIPNPRTA